MTANAKPAPIPGGLLVPTTLIAVTWKPAVTEYAILSLPYRRRHYWFNNWRVFTGFRLDMYCLRSQSSDFVTTE